MNPIHTIIGYALIAALLAGAGWTVKRAFVSLPQARQEAAQAMERNATLSEAYASLGASVRVLSQKQRQTEESYDAIRRKAAARGKTDGCGLCAPVRGDLDGLRRTEAGRLHPDPGQ
ncbi:MAG TPA: hypothetical protein PKX87_05250 [Alphaproteobacteria bacterium]|nr:hypothetical protein [Alphaproteobacteria bacterium]